MIRELTLADKRLLAQITDALPRQIHEYMDELITTPDFVNHI
jgi:hypothetical protein